MVNVSVARRYARALLEAGADKDADRVSTQLESLNQLVHARPELQAFLADPTYTRAQQHAVVDVLIRELPIDAEPLPRFLRLLIDRRRLASLPLIARKFSDLADAKAGRIRGKVVSAVALSAETVKQLETVLSSVTQSKVLLQAEVDPSVLGGVSTQVGSVLYDGTLRTGLDEIRRALKR